jgi:succinate dehydrogenase/fumarate reductase cytochrome b subunit
MRGRATGVVLPALAVLVLVAIVGVAATGSTPSGTDRSRAPSDSLLDAVFTLWLVAAAAGGVLLVYGLLQRKAIAQELASGRYRRTTLGAWVAFVLVLTAVVSIARYLNLRPQPRKAVEEEPQFDPGQLAPTKPNHKPIVDYHAGISWLVVGVVGTLAVAAICAYLVSRRRSRAADASEELAEQLALALDDALDDLRAETDPRRAIVAAYARMERVLAASGVPRRSSETADEYLGRVLRELAPGSDAVARLTGLFTQAKFSHHDVDATMKEEAIEALEQVRDELRQSPGGQPAAGDATPAGVLP